MLNIISFCLHGWSVQFLSVGIVQNPTILHPWPQRREPSSAPSVHTRHPDGKHQIFMAHSCTSCGYLIRNLLFSRDCFQLNSSNSIWLLKKQGISSLLDPRNQESFSDKNFSASSRRRCRRKCCTVLGSFHELPRRWRRAYAPQAEVWVFES